MVGLVLVSHSRDLAEAVLRLVRSMCGEELPIATAAGIGEQHEDLGTDVMEIYAAIESVAGNEGALVIMDMGSAVLSAEMALDFLDPSIREKTLLCPFSFVEGAVAAGVAAKIGSSLQEVYHEASLSLTQKEQHIGVSTHSAQEQPESLENAVSVTVLVPNPHGLHARPVANLIQKAASYSCEIQIKNLSNGRGPVSVRSMTGIAGLEAMKGNEIELTAFGVDAEIAIESLQKEIEKGLGDVLDEQAIFEKSSDEIETYSENDRPIGVSRGIVIGKIFQPRKEILRIPENQIDDSEKELVKFKLALEKTASLLKEKAVNVSVQAGKEQGAIFLAQAAVLQDPDLIEKSIELISNRKFNAAHAWFVSIERAVEQYKGFKDKNLQQRALDLQDVSRLVLQQLGLVLNDKLQIPEAGIILVDDITPGQVAELDLDRVKGVICLENGPSSHSSILLRSRGVPAIVLANSLSKALRAYPPSDLLAINGATGEIWLHPSEEDLRAIQEKQEQEEKKNQFEKEQSLKPAISLDGVRIELFANVGRAEDAETAKENGAEGVGLFRTEFMFIERDDAPNEEEQLHTMEAILKPMKGTPIIIRTLDAGGDKEIPYLNMPKEANPYLGVRAIRLCLRNPELFQQQLRAILRINTDFDIRIMFPMITSLEELRQAKSELEKAHLHLLESKIAHRWPIQTGMMIEVPAAAILADVFAKEVDFISIGTNDLVQYTMAADRGNPMLQTSLGKGLSPAVIRLLKQIVDASKKQGILLGVCGEAASDPELALILLSLGVTELSMNGRSIPAMKQWIRTQSMQKLREGR